MELTFLGVRGSTCAPGPRFVRYGGHTACVAVTARGGDRPVLLLDAGTGIRSASAMLRGEAFRGTVLVSHLHWDHVQGLPFFAAGDREDARVTVQVPAQGGASGRDLLAQLMSPPGFPIEPEGLIGDWSFEAVEAGKSVVEGLGVTSVDVEHKGGRTFGYVLEEDGRRVAYVPDHAPAVGVSDELLAALQGVDVLVHDAQFLEWERPRARDYGHATVDDAVHLGERVGARRLVLFHHGPHREDDALDTMAQVVPTDLEVVTAREGMVLKV
ncbi:MBL fold metallo-hydrolase [Phycicoccus duodecadis]|uniref:Phosphoribosyl 1,2-cyclic phosphodiesterase n=1 Tax=Phycicoccus duodecadis TaxID=173053 RepID=A0A2N3YF16_9MICO|nr:MBL fold metallo-hydrolase [Phycicoccus duodecadis]PKW25454.1 phosphoribosyl 1,2-cyclic phosphodiesterase [Phycicoccus duodecadis]